ncbi:DNA-binding protein [Micromonospora sp. LHW51205]|uniref:helix-turn-helix domain-containing protein n=1 Tax=Micromonospora sp. LHW51205 TaxID=2248752 RepID=UPI000DEA43AC|nr:helix-turn-helix domain-containing protein [Micromonospora sp. LHW51205]RBQ03878.1 DNA-binding protein [Micromonospora sp. LHW51205]
MSTTTTGERKAGQVWTIEAVRELGLTTDVETAAAILGVGRTKAYALARTGEFPVRLLRVGRRYVVPVQAILNLLAVE